LQEKRLFCIFAAWRKRKSKIEHNEKDSINGCSRRDGYGERECTEDPYD
jgi:hypothetical protein